MYNCGLPMIVLIRRSIAITTKTIWAIFKYFFIIILIYIEYGF